MRGPKTIYKICGPAWLAAYLSACAGGEASEEVDIAPEEIPLGGSGSGGGEAMGGSDAVGGSLDKPPEDPGDQLTTCPDMTSGFASSVAEFSFGVGQDFGRDEFPEQVLGAPHGGGLSQGSLHVTSLGDGGMVVLGFAPRAIIDGEGPDFIVFENPFYAGGDPNAPVAELGRVAVSVNGHEWHEFPCEPGDIPPYPGCAGWTPVEANVTDPDSSSPFDPNSAGGEAYDLSDLGLVEAKFVRVTDIPGDDYVFDLDAVSIVNGRCE